MFGVHCQNYLLNMYVFTFAEFEMNFQNQLHIFIVARNYIFILSELVFIFQRFLHLLNDITLVEYLRT